MDPLPIIVTVRVWRRPEGTVFEVRALRGGERRRFRDAAELVAYLHALSAPAPGDRPAGGR